MVARPPYNIGIFPPRVGTIELAKSLICFRTEAPPGSEKECASFIRDHILDMQLEGAEVQLQEFQKGRANLIATFAGGSPGLVLAGHSDVVPPGDVARWRSSPWEAETRGGRLYGRGAADMKVGLAAMLTAMESLKGRRLKRSLAFVVTAGEEVGFDGINALIAEGVLSKIRARFGVVGEPSRMKVIRAHKGAATLRITFEGRSAHASDASLGINAIEECFSFMGPLEELRSELARRNHPDLGSPTLTPTIVSGGTKSNVIPGRCDLTVDCRLVPPLGGKQILSRISKILKELRMTDNEFSAKAELLYETPALSIPRKSEAVRTCESLTGSPSEVALYGSEASVYTANGIPTVVMGPGSIEQAHTVDEYAPLEQISRAESVYRRLIEDLCL